MDKQKIVEKTQNIKTKEDLLALLNSIKIDELGSKAYPISMRQMNYHSNPDRSWNRFKVFKIPKKSGGFRLISAPNKGLKDIQNWLNRYFQTIYTPSNTAMGFTAGRSVVDNAQKHIGQNYVFNIDLKDFFPSIKESRIWNRLQLEPFNLPSDVAQMVAGMCCMKDFSDKESPRFVLPQGAPTSPLLTNAICDTLDRRLQGLAKRFGLNYSRYADDITFSSLHNVYQENSEFRTELNRIISEQGFTINEAKTRLQKKGARQEVTGLIVSNKVNVTRKYVREIRQLLYIWQKYGYSVAYNKFYTHYKAEKGYVKKGKPNLENVLLGKLLYLKMVKGENDPVYQKLHAQYKRLCASLEILSIKHDKLTYLETYSIIEFENKHQSKLEFTKSEGGHPYAYYMRDGKKQVVSLSRAVNDFNKAQLQISLCSNGAKEFYMIHLPLATITIILSEENETDNSFDKILDALYKSDFNLDVL